MSHKPIKVYQKDKDKGKGKAGGPPSIKVKDNLLPPPPNTSPVIKNSQDQPIVENMNVEDMNPNPEVLYIVDVDTQKINIVVDKDTTGKIDMTNKPPVTEQTDQTQDEPVDDNKEQQVDTQTETETEKQIEKQEEKKALEQAKVHMDIEPLTTGEDQKPLLKEMETQTDLPEVTTSLVTSTTDSIQNVGSTSASYKSTNVTEVLLDSIKRITDCSSQAYKAIDDTFPILKKLAPNCNIDSKDSLSQIDILSQYITENTMTIEKIKEEALKNKMEIEKQKFFEDQIKKCKRDFDTLLPELCNLLKEFKTLYKDICKTNLLIVDTDKQMSKVHDEINKLADNFVNSLDTLSVFEQKITNFEEDLLKLGREKERIVDKAKSLRLRLSPRLDYLAFMRKEIFEELVQGQRIPTKHMQHLIGTVQRTETTIRDSKKFMESINLILVDIFQIVTTQVQG